MTALWREDSVFANKNQKAIVLQTNYSVTLKMIRTHLFSEPSFC